jgi:hypothetical protein
MPNISDAPRDAELLYRPMMPCRAGIPVLCSIRLTAHKSLQPISPGDIIIATVSAPKLAQIPNTFAPLLFNISTWFESCKGLRPKTLYLSETTPGDIYDTKITAGSPPTIPCSNSL